MYPSCHPKYGVDGRTDDYAVVDVFTLRGLFDIVKRKFHAAE